MIGGLPLGFAQPLVLLGLLSLPVLWWLLRLIPPRPRRIDFPPTRLLFDIAPKEETPARTPWWLTLLRLSLAALVILAAAGPLWNPSVATSGGSAPLALLIDDGWAAAATWDARIRTAEDMLARAEADGRAVAIIPLSEAGRDISLQPAAAARVRAAASLTPKPHAVERTDALPALTRFLAGTARRRTGLAVGRRPSRPRRRIRLRARRHRRQSHRHRGRRRRRAGARAHRCRQCRGRAHREGAARECGRAAGRHRARARPEGLAARRSAASPSSRSDRETDAALNLPVEIRNDIARLEIVGERSAGAVQLLDKRWRRRTVGVITGATADTAQPLLASTYYLQRALGPVRRRADGRADLAGRCGHPLHRPECADADPGRCRQCRGSCARAAGQLGRGRRRAGALCRPAACGLRRRLWCR